MKNFVVCILLLFVLPVTVSAEGRCPSGMYPIDGQGVSACAPIPGAARGAPASPPQPHYRWEDRWGAIAQSSGGGASVGFSSDARSDEEAQELALEHCRNVGRPCVVTFVYRNECAALAWGSTGEKLTGGAAGLGGGVFMDLAQAKAKRQCKSRGTSPDCQVVYTGCSFAAKVFLP